MKVEISFNPSEMELIQKLLHNETLTTYEKGVKTKLEHKLQRKYNIYKRNKKIIKKSVDIKKCLCYT